MMMMMKIVTVATTMAAQCRSNEIDWCAQTDSKIKQQPKPAAVRS